MNVAYLNTQDVQTKINSLILQANEFNKKISRFVLNCIKHSGSFVFNLFYDYSAPYLEKPLCQRLTSGKANNFMDAVKINPLAIRLLSNRSWKDPEQFKKIITEKLTSLISTLKKPAILSILDHNLMGYTYAEKSLKSDSKVLEKLLRIYPTAFSRTPREARTKELCLMAISKDPNAAYHIPMNLYGEIIPIVPQEIKNKLSIQVETLVIIQGAGLKLGQVPLEQRSFEVCKAAVTCDGLNLEFVPKDLIGYQEIQTIACKQNPKAFQFIPQITLPN